MTVSNTTDRPTPIAFESLPKAIWIGSLRVRFAHCDPAGIVYFPRYFELVHGVIEDWMEAALRQSHAALTRDDRIGLGYAHAEADYFTPGFDDDRMTAAIIVDRIGRSSIKLVVPVYRETTPILTANLVMVTTSLRDHTTIPVPPNLRTAVLYYMAATNSLG